MAFVRVEQRNARLAAGVRLDTVQGKEGPLTKGTAVAISNVRRGSGEGREEETTSIQWTFWGKQAESAAEYLGKGSRVNIVGRVQTNNYENADKVMVYGLTFTCEEIDYLDSRMEAEARRAREAGEASPKVTEPAPKAGKTHGRARPPSKASKSSQEATDDVPF